MIDNILTNIKKMENKVVLNRNIHTIYGSRETALDSFPEHAGRPAVKVFSVYLIQENSTHSVISSEQILHY